ncbi:MAG: AMP-binding protein [Acholeplasmatales bacterium]|nr:AMP-binding protein [Acholeplasmatales bacterium]
MVNANKIVRDRCNRLTNSDKQFKDIFEIMFIDKDNILAERNDGYRIFKTTYNEAYHRIYDVAYSINKSYPDLKNEYVGISCESSVEWIIIFWGILASGNKPYLINMRHPKPLSNNILKSLNVRYVLGFDFGYEAKLIKYDELYYDAPSGYEPHFENEIALSTSATTMKEKIIFYSGEEISAQIFNCKAILKQNKQIKKFYHGYLKQLVFLPLYHIFGLMAVYLWFSFFGRTFVFLNDYSPDTILKTIRKHEVTHIFAVPIFWSSIEREINKGVEEKGEKTKAKFNRGINLALKLQTIMPHLGLKISNRLLREVTNNLFGKSVRFCISGGGAVKDSTMRIINALGYPLYNGYGMTEIGITSVELSKNVNDRLKNSIGYPFSSVEYKIENNELYVKGESISHKALIDNKLTVVEDYFKTNDIMHQDNDGRYYIDGRVDDIYINETGENINPDLVEKLLNLDFLVNSTVTTYEGKLVLIAQIKEYNSKATLDNINKRISDELAKLPLNYTISKYYFTYDDLMASTAIKVSRKYVEYHISNGDIKLLSFDNLKVDTEEINSKLVNEIKEIMAEILGKNVSDINDNDNFFYDLGASSLDYFTLINELNNKYDISLEFDDNANMVNPVKISSIIEERI